MRIPALLPLLLSGFACASSWSFEDGSVTILPGKANDASSGTQKRLFADTKLSETLSLSSGDSLKLALTVTNGKKPRRAHQAFLTLTHPESGLEESFAFSIKDSGKADLDLTENNIPAVLVSSKKPLEAFIVIGSFGASTPYKSAAFKLNTRPDPTASPPAAPDSPRYSARPEIHHIFRADPRSPAKIITLVFTLAVLASLPALLIVWGLVGANLNHLQKSLAAAPTSHALFFGSIVAMEGVFWKYYTSWNLFQTLPVASIIGAVAFISGSSALTEVQERRLKGER